MMKTLALRNGDLVVSGNALGMVKGVARVQQQVGLCLREPYGSDRFHPGWGSVLPEWIGRAIEGSGIQLELRAELIRVVKNFISSQTASIERRAVRGLRPVIEPAEILVDITDIKVIQERDSLVVKATLRTAGNREFSIVTAPGRTDAYTQ